MEEKVATPTDTKGVDFKFNGFTREEIEECLRISFPKFGLECSFDEFLETVQYTDSEYIEIGSFLVQAKAPNPNDDRYARTISEGNLVFWENRAKGKLTVITLTEGWNRNLLIPGTNGEGSRIVKQNFRFLDSDREDRSFGKNLLFLVHLRLQKNYDKGTETLILDFWEASKEVQKRNGPIYRLERGAGPVKPEMRNKKAREYPIPGLKDKFIRFTPLP